MALDITNTVWDFSALFANDDDPKIEENKRLTQKAIETFVNKWELRDDYLSDPKVLAKALGEYEELMVANGPLTLGDYYYFLRLEQETDNPVIKAKSNQANDFSTNMQNMIQFFGLRISKINKQDQEKFLSFPALSKYKHYLKLAFDNSKYLLSEESEKVMNLKAGPAYYNWVKMTDTFLSKEEAEVLDEDGSKKIVSLTQAQSMISSKVKATRDSAALEINKVFFKYLEVAENELNSVLGNKKIDDELRGAKRPDEIRHAGDDIESKVIDALLNSVSSRYDISQRYYKLKSQLLGLPKLAYHERNIEYGKVDKKYEFNEAAELVYIVLNNLDKEFGDIFKMFIEKGRFDIFPRKGKTSGAFCAGESALYTPTYILLNYTGKLNDILTIAHESGHGINNELSRAKQSALYYGTSVGTAECASTFMEDFVLQELIKTADDETKLSIMMQKLNDDISSISRQVACYKFEQDLHLSFREKGYLSAKEIGELFQKNMSAYMGDFVEQSEGSQNWWVYWSHIRNFFYVYSYASGLLISKALQNNVKKDPRFIYNVKDFLSAGESQSPSNIFKNIGIDITTESFWNAGLAEIENLLNETEALAKKLGKI